MELRGIKEIVEEAKKVADKEQKVMSEDEIKELQTPKWVKMTNTVQMLGRNDVFILGHSEVQLPAVVSRSSISGVKARLVMQKGDGIVNSLEDIKKTKDDKVTVLKEWKFSSAGEQVPVYFASPHQCVNNLWVEMMNPSEETAHVSAMIHGMIRSRQVK